MRSLFLKAEGDLEIVDVGEPSCGPYDVVIAVKAGGICGSDVSTYLGHHPFRQPPVVLGHEVAGQVMSIGAEVTQHRVGQRVAVEPLIPCGTCRECHEGHTNLCANRRVPGKGWAGTFSDLITAPESVVHEIPDHLSYAEASLIEPTAVSWRACRLAEVSSTSRVAVLGAGAIGSLAAAISASLGSADTLVTDVKDFNLSIVGAIEGIRTINVATRSDDLVREAGMFDAVIVAAAAPGIFDQAIQLCRPGGKIVNVALFDYQPTFQVNDVTVREISIVGSYVYDHDDFRAALELLSSGGVSIAPFLTQVVPLAAATNVFADIARGMDHMKIVIDFSQEGA
jgi:L-iditol 2-dehydrogenase